MDWKEIQSEWKQEGMKEDNQLKEFSIPTEKKMERVNNELRLFQQDWGQKPSIVASIVFLVIALMVAISIGVQEFRMGEESQFEYLLFVFVPLAISNLARALVRNKLSPDKDLLGYLKGMRRDIQWVRFQQYGIGGLFVILFPFSSLFQSIVHDGFDGLKILLILLVPLGLIVGALLWFYKNHYPYQLENLNKSLKELIKELEENN